MRSAAPLPARLMSNWPPPPCWASRALVRCRQPEAVAEQLRGAALMDETLYGMLAREALGQALPDAGTTPDLGSDD